MEHLKNLLAGAAGLFSALGPRPYPVNGGFAQDRRNLRGDFRRVGDGLRAALKDQPMGSHRGKSADPR